MGLMNAARIVTLVVAILVSLASIGFLIAGVMTTAWQVMHDPLTHEIHQHGLWLDYTWAQLHVATSDSNSWQWIQKYKFGEAVRGDEVHRAQSYQISTLALVCCGTVALIVGTFLSYCSGMHMIVSCVWSVLTLLGTILCAAGVANFFVAATMPDHRFVAMGTQMVLQDVGYSFWYTVVGVIGAAIFLLLSIICTVLLFFIRRSENDAPKTVRRYVDVPITSPQKNGHLGHNTQV